MRNRYASSPWCWARELTADGHLHLVEHRWSRQAATTSSQTEVVQCQLLDPLLPEIGKATLCWSARGQMGISGRLSMTQAPGNGALQSSCKQRAGPPICRMLFSRRTDRSSPLAGNISSSSSKTATLSYSTWQLEFEPLVSQASRRKHDHNRMEIVQCQLLDPPLPEIGKATLCWWARGQTGISGRLSMTQAPGNGALPVPPEPSAPPVLPEPPARPALPVRPEPPGPPVLPVPPEPPARPARPVPPEPPDPPVLPVPPARPVPPVLPVLPEPPDPRERRACSEQTPASRPGGQAGHAPSDRSFLVPEPWPTAYLRRANSCPLPKTRRCSPCWGPTTAATARSPSRSPICVVPRLTA
jgi:hypothetical protein